MENNKKQIIYLLNNNSSNNGNDLLHRAARKFSKVIFDEFGCDMKLYNYLKGNGATDSIMVHEINQIINKFDEYKEDLQIYDPKEKIICLLTKILLNDFTKEKLIKMVNDLLSYESKNI